MNIFLIEIESNLNFVREKIEKVIFLIKVYDNGKLFSNKEFKFAHFL